MLVTDITWCIAQRYFVEKNPAAIVIPEKNWKNENTSTLVVVNVSPRKAEMYL